MRVEWKKELEVGFGNIDSQHKELFRRFNSLLDACNQGKGKDEVMRLLVFLQNYISSHFKDEERLQRETYYPLMEEHIAAHRHFEGELRKLEEEYRKEGTSVSLVIRLNQFVLAWLLQHIGKMDKDLGAYIRENM